VEAITEPGTIEDLVTDAANAGYKATVRLIRDWTEVGLLDHPQKRSAGKGHGSSPALYTANQRMLFLTLLDHRAGNSISSVARIPVSIWMYWGEQHVPLRQVRRAMPTWIGDPRVSMRRARDTANEILRQLDNPRTTKSARRELVETLAHVAYTARPDRQPDYEQLEQAVRNVFEPGSSQIRRAVGHPAAPLVADAVVDLVKARLAGVGLLISDELPDNAFHQARQVHLVAYAEYAARWQSLADAAPPQNPDMYQPVTTEIALSSACGHLLTAIGMAALHPTRAAQLSAEAAPVAERAAQQLRQVFVAETQAKGI
jgi:hypothetical protein